MPVLADQISIGNVNILSWWFLVKSKQNMDRIQLDYNFDSQVTFRAA